MTVHSVARAYVAAQHEPQHISYATLAAETRAQYREVLRHVQVEPVSGTLVGSSLDLFRDIRHGLLRVAVDGSPMMPGHPFEAWLPEYGVSLNTAFRAVHDYFGHFATGAPFETFAGELRAYRAHRAMYSHVARAALYCETVAQLCFFYDTGRYVEVQKCAILAPSTIVQSSEESK